MSILRASNVDANSKPKDGCVGEAQAIMVILVATKRQRVNGGSVPQSFHLDTKGRRCTHACPV